MGLATFIYNAIGAIPGPLLLGGILDSTHKSYRLSFSLTLISIILAILILVLALILVITRQVKTIIDNKEH